MIKFHFSFYTFKLIELKWKLSYFKVRRRYCNAVEYVSGSRRRATHERRGGGAERWRAGSGRRCQPTKKKKIIFIHIITKFYELDYLRVQYSYTSFLFILR